MDDGNSVKRRRTANNSSASVVFEYAGEDCFIPKNVVHVKFHPSVVWVPFDAFCKCTQLREVVFNEGLEEIGSRAFQQCTSLESVALPSSVTEIDERAFGMIAAICVRWYLMKGWRILVWGHLGSAPHCKVLYCPLPSL